MTDGKFSERLKALCNDYYEVYMETPPMPVSTHTRMNSLLAGTRKPTMDELVAISEAYDVSINYLLVGDEMFPSLWQLEKKDADRIMKEIEGLKPGPECCEHKPHTVQHLRYGVIVANYKKCRFIIARVDTEKYPLLFLREWVDEKDDPYNWGEHYTLCDAALSASQADEILEYLKEGDMQKARILLKRYLIDCEEICADVGPVILDDYIPDAWYDVWKEMEAIITCSRHHPGYYEADVAEQMF